MFCFISGVRHRDTVSDWEIYWRTLLPSIRSICNQTSRNFRFILSVPDAYPIPTEVFNELLKLEPQLVINFQNFPAPISINRTHSFFDKYCKLRSAWEYAEKEFDPDWIMSIDVDDFVSQHLITDFMKTGPSQLCTGYYFVWGHILHKKIGYWQLARLHTFHRACGSCNIFNPKKVNVRYQWMSRVLKGDHGFFKSQAKNHTSENIPQPLHHSSVVYHQSHSFNVTWNRTIIWQKRHLERYGWIYEQPPIQGVDEKQIVEYGFPPQIASNLRKTR